MDTNGLVRFSRAGDAFHYRWAARRCLSMIGPNSLVSRLVIEGSMECELAGEYVIDVAEYRGQSQKVFYYQLKHTTRRLDQPIKLSDIRNTIEGFADRFKSLDPEKLSEVEAFELITNRPVCKTLKENHRHLIEGNTAQPRFLSTLKKYTGLSGKKLNKFCSLLILNDGEGNYLDQRDSLQRELSQLVAGTVDNPTVDTLIAMVGDKALPDNEGIITEEDVLKRMGVSSIDDLFPAPTEFEDSRSPIQRRQQDELLQTIIEAQAPVIIHAEGGVGKSVICRQLAEALPSEWECVIYDCFGAGKYRNRSQPRHRYRDFVAQVCNELAINGLCEPFIPGNSDLADALLRSLKSRLSRSVESIRKKSGSANLVLFIDAADNAEMAADEFNESCFASQLLREDFPEGCKIVALCRTERVGLLNPTSNVVQKLLEPFDEAETWFHGRQFSPNISSGEADELHRLTAGNPRVQANALSVPNLVLTGVLESLGPSPTTIEDQINDQLQRAIFGLKDSLPEAQHDGIDSICYGLANLPPLIPLEVLAIAANVHESLIKSFVSDLGRPLWLSDHSVMFRDEPTETWFVNQFSASQDSIGCFAEKLKPLADDSSYVAEAIPSLLLKAGRYSELIELSLSDSCLPSSPIDARNVRLYRLQFAFKASLKEGNLADATKLAMLAGEEVSSEDRQFDLLRNNVDLLEKLQSEQHVQDLAYRKELRGSWQGSENVYSSSLLSWIPDCKGDSKAYLRAAENWLRIYFKQRDNEEESQDIGSLEDNDISELVSIHYKNFGVQKVSEFIFQWKPESAILSITPRFFARLVDIEAYEEINSILLNAKRDDPVRFGYLCLSATHELWRVNKTLSVSILRECLDIFLKTDRFSQRNSIDDPSSVFGAMCFAEACAYKKISKIKIRKFLAIHVLEEPSYSVYSEHHSGGRSTYLRSVALDNVLASKKVLSAEELVPQELLNNKSSRSDDVKTFKEIVGGLLPWYEVRAKVIARINIDIQKAYQEASKISSRATAQRYRKYDTLPSEIGRVQFEIFSFNNSETTREKLLQNLNAESIKFGYNDRIEALRVVVRRDDLSCVSDDLETNCYDAVSGYTDGGPEDLSDDFVRLARAVLPKSLPDSKEYFASALDSVSKFGHEITERWCATAAIANRYSESEPEHQETAYRFIRCAELVGENVAREKYIDRNTALNICASISPSTAAAALSRWHDRGIGYFEKQLVSVSDLFVERHLITGQVGFALEALSESVPSVDLMCSCIENTEGQHHKKYILDTSVRNLRMEEPGSATINKIDEVCKKLGLQSRDLRDAVSYYADINNFEIGKNRCERATRDEADSEYDYRDILKGWELASIEGVDAAILRFDSIDGVRSPRKFWQQCFEIAGIGNASILLENLVMAERADSFDIEYAIENIPEAWRNRLSVKKAMPKVVMELTRRFAADYANQYAVQRLEKMLDDASLNQVIQLGMLSGLGESGHSFGAQTFFSFAQLAAKNITVTEAEDVLDIVLSRWELHIPDDFGDGEWDHWLETKNLAESIAGLVWSALGSPKSNTRWSAAHSVRRLVEMACSNEIDELISFMNAGSVEPYGCKTHTFYELHAKLYLLIAFARASIETAECLKEHSDLFKDLAINSPHALIQHFASLVALNLVSHYPDIYDGIDISQLGKVNQSPYQRLKVESVYQTSLSSPWHETNDVDTSIDLSLSWDFDRYWYEPLGRVFGISSSQVQDLGKEIIKNDFGNYTGRYLDDTRKNLFEHNYEYRDTSHSHGSYPSVDSYSFYVSYHAMFMVAKKLLHGMPLIRSGYDDDADDDWFHWLSRHALTFPDGSWLSDRRDSPPLEKRAWHFQEKSEHWRWEISDDDFLCGLIRSCGKGISLNLSGHWNECNSTMDEAYNVASALVDKKTSNSLLNALTTCTDPHDFKLPNFLEDRMEIEADDFKLNGWVDDYSRDKRLDHFDYYSGDFYFPPLSIGQPISDDMGITNDSDNRYWYQACDDSRPVIFSFCWGAKPKSETDKYVRRGQRISVDFEFIKSTLTKLERDLIIEVQIERSVDDYRTNRDDDEVKYAPAYSKIYLLKDDGELRDATKSYQVGEADC